MKKGNTHEIILGKTEELVFKQGYAQVSLQVIANECSLQKASLYYHFKSKEDLINQLIAKKISELKDCLSDVDAAKLITLLEVELLKSFRVMMQFLFELPRQQKKARKLVKSYFNVLEDSIHAHFPKKASTDVLQKFYASLVAFKFES